jgi:hypothetical protein
MLLDLDEREAETLSQALDSRLGELARELARTEQRDLQHELAQVVSRLEAIAGRVRSLRHWPQGPQLAASRR